MQLRASSGMTDADTLQAFSENHQLWQFPETARSRYRDMIVFVHAWKAGGSTFYSILRDVHRLSALYKLSRDAEQLNAYNELDRSRRSSIRVIYGHLDYGVAGLEAHTAQYITFVREPAARVVSLYYYIRREPNDALHDLAKRTSLAEFIKVSGFTELDNGMVRRFSGVGDTVAFGACTRAMLEVAKRNLSQFAFVGLTERFDEGYALLCRRFGWPVRYYPGEKINRSRPGLGTIPPAAVDLIRRHNALDLELYQYCTQLYERQMRTAEIDGVLAQIRARRASAFWRLIDTVRLRVKNVGRKLAKKLRYYRRFG